MMSVGEVLERILLGQEGFLGRYTFLLTLESETAVLPPWTGRTSKSVALKLKCLESIKMEYLDADRFKRVTFTVLHHPRRGPLYVAGRGSRGPLVLSRGETVVMRVGFYMPSSIPPPCGLEEVDIGYARFIVEPVEAEFHSLRQITGRPFRRVRLRILTPMTVTTKILAPDLPEGHPLLERLQRAPERYRLLPTPGYLVAQLARQWLEIVVGQPARSGVAKLLGRLADALIAENSYRLRPVTAVYGKDEQGRMRRIRGVVGTIEMEVLDDWLGTLLRPLLLLGQTLGVGKSRSIGFGEVNVEEHEGDGQAWTAR